MTLEDDYETRCMRLAEEAEAVLRRPVTTFRRMRAEHGAVETTRRLIHAPHPSDTYSDLWTHRRLDLSVEAVVLTERQWDTLFTDADRVAAWERLRDYEWPRAGPRPREARHE